MGEASVFQLVLFWRQSRINVEVDLLFKEYANFKLTLS